MIRLTESQWQVQIDRILKKIGMTREELISQASNGDFSTHEAHRLWMMAGLWKNGKPCL